MASILAATTARRPTQHRSKTSRIRRVAGWLAVWAIGAMPLGTAGRATSAEPELRRYEFSQVHMGVPIRVLLYAADEPSANIAADKAFQRFAALDEALSDYDPASELSALSRSAGQDAWVNLSDDLWHVLQCSQQLAAATDGAFDVTVGPYVRLWRRARKTGQFPSQQRLEEARDATGYEHLLLDEHRQRAKLLRNGMQLDLGGIAMGYAADEALADVRSEGIAHAMIDASGDVAAGDAPPGERGWKIGMAPLQSPDAEPTGYVWLSNAALTNSGDAYQFVEFEGDRYSHIVDPRTGLGLTQRSSVTVVADNCITADSLATAVSVLGPTKGMELIAQTPGAEAFIITLEDGQPAVRHSPGWREEF